MNQDENDEDLFDFFKDLFDLDINDEDIQNTQQMLDEEIKEDDND